MRSPDPLVHSLVALHLSDLNVLMDFMWSLRDKFIYWDHDYQYCEFH